MCEYQIAQNIIFRLIFSLFQSLLISPLNPLTRNRGACLKSFKIFGSNPARAATTIGLRPKAASPFSTHISFNQE